MRLLVIGMLVVVGFAGCVDTDVDDDVPTDGVTWYRVTYEGADLVDSRLGNQWLSVVSNEGSGPVLVAVERVFGFEPNIDSPYIVGQSVLFAQRNGTARELEQDLDLFASPYGYSLDFRLDAGERALVGSWLFSPASGGLTGLSQTLHVLDPDSLRSIRNITHSWPVETAWSSFDQDVDPGDHVQTVTVGMWLNGTSFYTNAAAALEDPDFPGAPGWVTPEAGTDPLQVYVYDQDRSEQPMGSKDACRFTTIDGYNALLKEQRAGSTGIRLLQPEEAYTLPGYEDHDLYGDAIVFMNTVVAHDGSTEAEDVAPDPDGACYQRERVCGEAASDLPDGIPDEIKAPVVYQCEDALDEGA